MSGRLLIGESAAVAITNGYVVTVVIHAKSRTASNGSFAIIAAAVEWPAVARSSVWPSGAAFATRSEPITPPAPGLFSTTTGWPRSGESCCATTRATVSELPPGGKPTTMRTARSGYDCAWAAAATSSAAIPAATRLIIGDGVLEDADLVDLDLNVVAGLHPDRRGAPRADSARRAGDDHVARHERGPGRDVLDDLRDLEDHLLGGCVLHALAVQAA